MLRYTNYFEDIVDKIETLNETHEKKKNSKFRFIDCTAKNNPKKILYLEYEPLNTMFKVRFENGNRNHRR